MNTKILLFTLVSLVSVYISSSFAQNVMCTKEYKPVCGSKQVQCVTAPCPDVIQTYANPCVMRGDGANFLYEGACKTEIPTIQDDRKGNLEKAYIFAYENGITTMDTLEKFRAEDSITRQEAAKMFVMLYNNIADKNVDPVMYGMLSSMLFQDAQLFDPTLKPYIYTSYVLGIIKGSKDMFMPRVYLTKAQSIAILMRMVDGQQDETTDPWWKGYISRAGILNYFSIGIDWKNQDQPITRGELVQWIYGTAINGS